MEKMSGSTVNGVEVEQSPVQKLWRAVIASTVEEWVRGPLRKKREADKFLFTDNTVRILEPSAFRQESSPKTSAAA
jgi:hypothetical protein